VCVIHNGPAAKTATRPCTGRSAHISRAALVNARRVRVRERRDPVRERITEVVQGWRGLDGAAAIALASEYEKAAPNQEVRLKAHVGDKIVVESERADQPSRAGVIEEVLRDDPARVRVRWDDGHTSILAPSAGAAMITPGKTEADE
jgi:hypothetical protein